MEVNALGKLRVPFKIVTELFEAKGLHLLTKEEDYRGTEVRLDFQCLKHPDNVQPGVSYSKLKNGGNGCLQCANEKRRIRIKPGKLRVPYGVVSALFEAKGLKLLPTEEGYRGVEKRLAFRCIKHDIVDERGVSYHKLQQGGLGCLVCADESRRDNHRTPYKEIKVEFEKRNYELLTIVEEFTSTQIPLRYRCKVHPNKKNKPILYHNLLNNKGCRACADDRKAERRKKEMFPVVQKAFADRGLTLLETEYEDAKKPMRYACPEHPDEPLYKTYDGVLSSGCPFCKNEENSARMRTPQDKVEQECLKHGFKLLEGQEYINAHQTLQFQCLKHPDVEYYSNTTTIISDKGGCSNCKSEKISEKQSLNFAEGRQKIRRREENNQWKGGTTELNYYLRQRGVSWKKKWRRFYDYKCVITGERGGRLPVHHAEPFHKLRDEVLEVLGLLLKEKVSDYTAEEIESINREYDARLALIEGFPLKAEYHVLFHSEFGHNTNKDQILAFINRYKTLK